ncbi:MAG: 3-oxoacyl-ACP reductase, partial [Solirubrobacterales bacterium]
LYDFFHPVARRLRTCGRMVVIGTTPDLVKNPAVATAQQAIEGFTRSLAKEIGSGSTCQLIYVDKGAESAAESTLRFVLSARSAYVSGQVITVAKPEPKDPPETTDWTRPLDGKVALVTGASRGIGESIAETLARDGAHVIVLDVPAQGGALSEVANRLDGESLQLDVTADDAPTKLAEYLTDRHGGVDILIHNAGITRDKTLARMSDDQWDSVLGVNLTSQQRINDALFEGDVINAGGRIVCVSSMGGIAGNRGQTNYGASKAGIIGMVRAFAPVAKGTPATINAVAPGFIATDMTQKMPLVVKEAGRRMNSMNQAGTPKDVAETIAWMAQPGSGGVNGQVVRVCGQSLIGA